LRTLAGDGAARSRAHGALAVGPQAPLGSPALLAIGLSDQQIGSLPLPLDLTFLGAPGCNLYQDVVATVPASVHATQGATLLISNLHLARNYSLVGATFFFQGLISDPANNPAGLRTTSGLHLDFQAPPSPFVSALVFGSIGAPPQELVHDVALVLGIE